MEYLKVDGKFPRLSNSAVALGKFDGIHRGHRKLVEKLWSKKRRVRKQFFLLSAVQAKPYSQKRNGFVCLKKWALIFFWNVL